MITVFKVTSHLPSYYTESQTDNTDFTKIFTKIIPTYFQDNEKDKLATIFKLLTEPKGAKEMGKALKLEARTMKNHYLSKLLAAGILELTIPDKPTSRNQKYRLNERINYE